MEMGKPTATDLQLGLATAPVLFACEQVKENVKKIVKPWAYPCSFSLWLSFNNKNMNKCQCILEHGVESNRIYYFRQNLNDDD